MYLDNDSKFKSEIVGRSSYSAPFSTLSERAASPMMLFDLDEDIPEDLLDEDADDLDDFDDALEADGDPSITPIPVDEELPEITPDVEPEAEPEITPEVTPDAESEVTPETTPEPTPEGQGEDGGEPSPTPNAEGPVDNPGVTPEGIPDAA